MTAELQQMLTDVASAAQRTRGVVDAATAEQLADDSVLPDWNRAHVAAHICGFSHAMARQWEYALRGELVEQYDGGPEGRNADIEALAARPADELKVAVNEGLDRLAAAIESVTDWTVPISYRDGDALVGLEATWRELEIHLTDLDLGPTSDEWSAEFCAHLFDFLAPRAPEGATLQLRPDGGAETRIGSGTEECVVSGAWQDLAAWLAGREPRMPLIYSTGEAPELGPWPARRN